MTLIEVMMALSISSIAAVVALQALATIYRALDVAETRITFCDFVGTKMPELLMERVRQKEVDFSDSGSFRSGTQSFEWEGIGEPIAMDPALGVVTLTVRWRKGSASYESRVSTVVALPAEKKEGTMGEGTE